MTRWADLGPFQQVWVGTACLSTWLLFLLCAWSAESYLAGGEQLQYHKHLRESSRQADLIPLQELLMVAKFCPRSAHSLTQEIQEVIEKRSGEGIPPNEFGTRGLHIGIASGAGRLEISKQTIVGR